MSCFLSVVVVVVVVVVVFLSRPWVLLQVLPGDRVSAARGHPPEDGRAVLGQGRAVLARQELRTSRPRSPGEL